MDDSLLLAEITDPADAPCCIHGTYRKNLPSILSDGLSRMTRNHVHFAPGLPPTAEGADGKPGVISGMRSSCDVAIYLDVRAALQAGIKLFRSENGVLLSPGDADGRIPSVLFKKVVDLNGGQLVPLDRPPRATDRPPQEGSQQERQGREQGHAHEPTRSNQTADIISEVVGDLFARSYGAGDAICHCVSEDLNMGAGIAVQVRKRSF